jgi:hypothetical protein
MELLKRLQAIPQFADFRLVGGTALALQIGHRKSVDLDLFGQTRLEISEFEDYIREAGISDVKQYNRTKYIVQFFIEGIKTDIVNYKYDWIAPAVVDEAVVMADVKDIAAMKLSAIIGRGRKKDFIDMFFLLKTFSLKELIGFYRQKYSDNLLFALLRSLTYFEDAEQDAMPEMLIPTDWFDVKDKISAEVKKI